MCDPSGSSQAMPALSGASTVLGSTLVLDCNCKPVCSSFNNQTPSSKPTVLRRRKAFLLCKNPCGGTAVGMGSPPQSAEAPPAQRNFQRKFALRRVGSARFVVPLTSNHSKLRRHTRQEQSQYRAAPGCQRDRSPFCFGKSPEEPLPRGSFGQLLRGGSTPRFFSQIRSVGSKPPGWQGTASQPLVPGPRVQPKSPPLRAGSKKPVFPS